jgi:hypothetical protein
MSGSNSSAALGSPCSMEFRMRVMSLMCSPCVGTLRQSPESHQSNRGIVEPAEASASDHQTCAARWTRQLLQSNIAPIPGSLGHRDDAARLPNREWRRVNNGSENTDGQRSVRMAERVTAHNLSGRRDRSVAADPRQSNHKHSSWSWCFECSHPVKSRGFRSGPNGTALDR